MTIQPNVEDLLASIRKAIDGQSTPARQRAAYRGASFPEQRPRTEMSPAPASSRDISGIFSGERRPSRYEPPTHPETPAAILSLRQTQTDTADDWRNPPQEALAPEELHHVYPAEDREPPPASSESSYLPAPVQRHREEPALVSPRTSEAANAAFSHLANSLMARATGERSIEEMTQELLRSMLKQWLDDNLPEMVERLVREEIERVARRGIRR